MAASPFLRGVSSRLTLFTFSSVSCVIEHSKGYNLLIGLLMIAPVLSTLIFAAQILKSLLGIISTTRPNLHK